MIYKQDHITNTISIRYQYKIHPDQDAVTKLATASFASTYLNPYEFRDYKPVTLSSSIPINTIDIENIQDYKQEVVPLYTFKYHRFGFLPVLVTLFSLRTSITYYDSDRHYYTTSYWQKNYRMEWRIPSYFHDCEVEYSLKISQNTLNNALLSLRIITNCDKRQPRYTHKIIECTLSRTFYNHE